MSDEIYTSHGTPRASTDEDNAFDEKVRANALAIAKARGLTPEGTKMLVEEHLARARGPHSVYGKSFADGHMQDTPNGEPNAGVGPSGGPSA